MNINMKNLFILIFAIIPLLSISQAIKNSNIEINTGTGFGIYSVKDNDPINDTSKNNTAAAALLQLSFKYYVINNLGLGIDVERNGFAHDSSDKAHSLNLGLIAQYLILNKEKNVIYFDLLFGYSNFKYINNADKNWVTSSGVDIQPGVGFKHFFGKKIGYFLQSNYSLYKYGKIVDSKNNTLKTSDSKDYKISISGLNVKVGLIIKF